MFNMLYKMKKAIIKSDIVSFDIFDTLIVRNCISPSDIFDIVEKRYNELTNKKITNFKELRLEASKKAKKLYLQEEVNIDEIYTCLNLDADKKLLKKIEFYTECDYCVFNESVKELYLFAKKNNKRIICVSDMYFDKNKLKKILDNCGYEIDEIYSSCEFRCKKSTGKLFKEVLKIESIKNKKIVHFGDAEKGDFLFPKLLNIKTFLIRNNNINQFLLKNDINLDFFNNKIIYSMIKNKKNNVDEFYQFGYEVLGPICFNFCLWLKNSIANDSNKIFCARDMKIFQEFYDTIFPNERNLTSYFYVSRRSLRLPYLYKNNNYEAFCESITNNKLTITDVLENLNLLDEDVVNELNNRELNDLKKYSKNELINNDNFKKLYDEFMKYKISSLGKKQYEYLNSYLKSKKLKNACLIDMGWKGTTQNILIKLFPEYKWNSYYFGIDAESNYELINKENSFGYLFYKEDDYIKNAQINVYSCRDLFEKIFAAQHGSTIIYEKDEPYYILEKIKKMDDTRNSLRDGAIEFAKDIYKYIDDLEIKNNSFDYVNLLIKTLLKPTLKQAKIFGEIINDNMYERKIASPKSKIFYLKNFKVLKKDFRESGWKIGFMKRFFYIKFPYYSLYKFLFERKKFKK